MSTQICAIVCAGIAGALWPRGRSPAGHRLAGLLPASGAPADAAVPQVAAKVGSPWSHRAVAALAGGSCVLLLGGGLTGLLGGLAAAMCCARVLARLEPREVRRRRARLLADLPVAVDLLASCLRGGASWPEAVEAVAGVVAGPLGAKLRMVAVRIRLGADPAEAWLEAGTDPALAPLARAAARASNSGAALAPTLARLARDQRRACRAAAAARAHKAQVWAIAPLGLCFLPAFVLLGIVPAIAGIASTILLPW